MKKLLLISSLLFICFMTSGCFNYREINDLAVVSAVGIEKDEEDNNYIVSAQIVNIKKTGAEGGNEDISKVVLYKGKGHDIFSSIRDISRQSSKEIFLAHLKVLVISDDVIKNDLDEVIDYFARETESKINFYIMTTTHNKPQEILETLTPMDSLPSQDIYKSLETSEELMGNSSVMTYEEFLNFLLQKGINPVYSNLKVKGNKAINDNTNNLKNADPSSTIVMENLVTFDNVGNETILSKNESIGYNFILNKVDKPLITCKCEDESDRYFTIEVLNSKVKMKPNLKNDEVLINAKVSGTIGEINCNRRLNHIKTRKMISKIATKKIENMMNSTVDVAMKSKNDFIGIGNFIYKNDKDYFDFNVNDWDLKGLNKIKVKVNVDLNIIKEGNLEKNILEREINDKGKN